MEPEFEQILDQDFGEMYMIYDKALIVRSSNEIVFFRQERDPLDINLKYWKLYKTLDHRGNIYSVKGNTTIQITTTRFIYFYDIDKETLEPKILHVMYNFMDCSQIMFGSRSIYSITYKTGQEGFTLSRRKFIHDYAVQIDGKNYENSVGVCSPYYEYFYLSRGNTIEVYNNESFKKIQTIEVPFENMIEKNDGRIHRQKILNIKLSRRLEYMAVLVGYFMM